MRQFFGLFVLVSLVFLGCGGDATEKRAPLPVQSNEKEPGSSGSEYASDEGSSREYAYSKILDGLTILPRIYAEGITSKQKLVKTADITIEVLDFKLADKKIRELAIYKASYIASENETNYNLQMKNEMTIRVQSESFDSLTARILAISEFVHLKKITVDDVTDAFFDVQNRLETKKKS